MMQCVFVALFCVLALASAGTMPKISIDRACNDPETCPITLKTGMREKLTFKLDEPIICPQQDQTCSVVVLITNTNPKDVAVDTCMVKWFAHEWHQPRVVTVTAVESFVDDGEKTMYLRMKPAVSNSEYYKGFTAQSICIKTQNRPSRQCSGTGDPHYVTFDGYYWHQYWPGQVVFYKSTIREFEVQARMISRPYAWNCAFAALENNDLVIIDACNGAINIIPRITSPAGKGPRITWIGNRYTVTFPSGATVAADVSPHYMGIYVTAPGIDRGFTAGMCGNNNGNPNDDAPAYVVDGGLDRLFKSQQITRDLWAWQPPAVLPQGDALPPYAKECPYIEPTYLTPTIVYPDAEDITDLIKEANKNDNTQETKNFTFFPDDFQTVPMDPVSEEVARKACEKYILADPVNMACANVTGVNLQQYVTGCIDDVKLTGDDKFITDAARALEADCKDRALRDRTTWVTDANGNLGPNTQLTNLLCPNDCNKQGTCVQGRCQCTAPFQGTSCEYNPTSPPSITSLSHISCDSTGLLPCPAKISITAANLFNSDKLSCRFGTETTTAVFLGSTTVVCTVPARIHRGSAEETVPVSITNDGVTHSQGSHKFTWYDSVCQICKGNVCNPNTASCTIGGVCYSENSVFADNHCMTCQPSVSPSAWSFSYTNSLLCGPKFIEKSYTKTLVDTVAKDVVVLTVSAGNSLVSADTSNTITYTLLPSALIPPFAVNAKTGAISTTKAITYAELELGKRSFMFEVSARDAKDNEAHVSVRIDFLAVNQKPIFPGAFNATIKEDAAINTYVLTTNTTDTTNATYTFTLIYEEFGYAGTFGIDTATGSIFVKKALDFETKSQYVLQVRAMDGAGAFYTADINIAVTNVAEKPTDITLSANQIKENLAVGSLVGSLSAVDPEGGSFTFTLISSGAPFVVEGGQIKTTQSLNYEGGNNKYSVTVRATDSAAMFLDKSFEINVVDVNEAPFNVAIGQLEFSEDRGIDSRLVDITFSEPDIGQTGSCSLLDSTNTFEINNKVLVLRKKLDFETKTDYTIQVGCADNGEPALYSGLSTFNIKVLNANDAPEDVVFTPSIQLLEDTKPGVKVGTVSANDHDSDAGPMTFSIVGGDRFVLGTPSCVVLPNGKGSSCTVDVTLGSALDYEQYPEEQIVVQAFDNKNLLSKTTLSIAVFNVNEPPTGVTLDVNQIEEKSPTGTKVGVINVDDPDQDSTFTITLIDANSAFSVKSSSVRRAIEYSLVVANSSLLDFETKSVHSVAMRVSDGTFTRDLSVNVYVTDKAMTITAPVALTVDEASSGALAGSVQLNDFDLRSKYSVSFKISGVSAFSLVPRPYLDNEAPVIVDVRTSAALNFESVKSYTISVTASFTPKTTGIPALSDVNAMLEVTVKNVNEAPEFTVLPRVFVARDQATGKFAQVTVADPENDAITLSLDSNFGLFQIDSTGAILLIKSPLDAKMKPDTLNLKVIATSNGQSSFLIVPVEIKGLCAATPCFNGGTCAETETSFKCSCKKAFKGATCFDTDTSFTEESTSAGASIGAGAIVGIVIAILFLLVVVILVFIVIVRRRKTMPATAYAASRIDPETADFAATNPMYCPPIRKDPTYDDIPSAAFTPGRSNPLYSWYSPEMSRQECDEYLMRQGEGAFVIRDSAATPGWHILGVKTRNQVVHDKIKVNLEGNYELLPTTTSSKQPAFQSLPELVEYYGTRRDASMPYQLAFDNPIYDNHQLKSVKSTPVNFQKDAAAPAVPMHDRDKVYVEQIAQGSDMYINSQQAKAIINSDV